MTNQKSLKRNELYSLVSSIAVDTLNLTNAEAIVKHNKAELSARADKVVNHFMDKNHPDELCDFLSDSFAAMDKEAMFGIRGVKMSSTSTKDRVTYNMERTAKFFHRSFKALDNGFTLKGYNPFVVAEAEEKKEKSNEEKLLTFCQELGMDAQAGRDCLQALKNSDTRAYDRQAEAREAMRKEKESLEAFEKVQKLDRLASALSESGLTNDEIQALIIQANKSKSGNA